MNDENCQSCKYIVVLNDNIKAPVGNCHRFPNPVRKDPKSFFIGCGEYVKGAMKKLAPEKEITEKPPLKNQIVADGGGQISVG
jgi:hypothetical protein